MLKMWLFGLGELKIKSVHNINLDNRIILMSIKHTIPFIYEKFWAK